MAISKARFLIKSIRILLEDWHIMHESFAFCLQDLKEYSPYIVNSLYNTAMKKFPYLEFENSEALARKCIYALGAIDTVESRNKLIELAKIDNVAVRDYAIHQLKKNRFS